MVDKDPPLPVGDQREASQIAPSLFPVPEAYDLSSTFETVLTSIDEKLVYAHPDLRLWVARSLYVSPPKEDDEYEQPEMLKAFWVYYGTEQTPGQIAAQELPGVFEDFTENWESWDIPSSDPNDVGQKIVSEAVKVTLDELKTWGVERYPDNPFDYDEALDVVFKEDTTLRRSIEPIVIDRSEAEKDLLHERPIHPFEHTRRTIDMEKPPIKERLNVVVDYATAASLDHPERNEDYLIVSQENIFGVFDGLGGHEGGEKASEVAARTCSDLLLHIEPQTTKEAEDMMIAALRASNIAIGQLELTPGAATTASLVYIWQKDSEWQVTIGNVGDSQIYLQRGDSLDVIGYDKVPDSAHNYMRFWSKVGQLAQNVSTRDELADKVQKAGMTDEEAGYTAESIASDFFRQMRYRMNTALGRNPTNYEMMIATYPLQSNDRLALMTDGVTDPLTTDAIHEIVSQPKPAQNLLEHAENLGPVERKKPDDRTAIVIEIPELADWR